MPHLFKGSWYAATPADCWVDLRDGWVKGTVSVNGHALGRYWDVGPHRALYLPAPFIRAGSNELLVFELLPSAAMVAGNASVLLVDHRISSGPFGV